MFDNTDMECDISTSSGPVFVAMDKWLKQIEYDSYKDRNGAAQIVRESFQNNIRANICYYEGLARGAEENYQTELALRSKNMAKLYQLFLA